MKTCQISACGNAAGMTQRSGAAPAARICAKRKWAQAPGVARLLAPFRPEDETGRQGPAESTV